MTSSLGPLDDDERDTLAEIQLALSEFLDEQATELAVNRLDEWVKKLRRILGGYRLEQERRSERAQFGYAWADVGDGTSYILLVIAGIADELAEEDVYPEELDNEPDALAVWHAILYTISLAFRRYGLCLQYREHLTNAELVWAEEEADQAMKLFAHWYKYFREN